MTVAELVTVEPDPIARDHYGRPLVAGPKGGKPVAYTRCTTYVGCLEDTYNLSRWQQRMVLLGMAERPDLALSVVAHKDDKKRLNTIADECIEAAKAHAAATIGTALHALCEQHDRGQELRNIPAAYQADIAAYIDATAPLKPLHIETFSVQDDLRIGGTPDRIVEFDGERYIADIKTGSIEFGIGKIAMQLAVYAHSVFYDPKTKKRSPLPGVNGQRAIIIHLPAGTGTCTLVWVDIAAGWEAVQLATQVRAWRSRKGLTEPWATETEAVAALTDAGVVTGEITLDDLIDRCRNRGDLEALWSQHEAQWTAEHTARAAARIQALTA